MSKTVKTPQKSVAKSQQTGASVKSSKIVDKSKETKSKSNGPWHFLAPIDVSLENRPILRPINPGERQLDLAVQTGHAALPQDDLVQVDVRLRAQISIPEGLAVVAEVHCLGIAIKSKGSDQIAELQEQLYGPTRAALQTVLALAGHTPPLPTTLQEILSLKNQ
ncbi:MAG: hypothetical protein INF43_00290 [Alphaproteobacteria bacterium]|nr:hypothetical protein [Alphaproteobacteria bacterium]